MIIYNDKGIELLNVDVDDASYAYSELCGNSQVKVLFSLAEYVSIPTGSYIEYEGVQYTLLSPASITKAHTRSFDYVLLFEAPQSLMGLYIVRNLVDGRVNFPLTATPQEHLQLIVDNLNQRDNGWLKGSCIAAKEKTINYNKISCYDALKLIADEFESEFEVVDKRVSIGKVVYYENTPIMLSYGNGNGFVSGVTRQNFDNSKSLAAIYPEGSERNIDSSKYGSMTLLLPKSALILYDGLHFEGEIDYDGSRAIAYFTDARGLSVYRDTSIGNKAEGTLDCTEIYPSRVGKVTSVIEVSAKDNLYDVIDVSIPKALDYQACRIAGEEMIIAFQSGMLAGREFVVAEYKHAERRFIIAPQTYDGETMPSAKYPISIGDEYAVFGIALPDAYICDNASKSGASWDMLRKCVRYLYDNEQPRYSFTGDIDAIWAENNWDAVNTYFRVGASVQFMDAQIQVEPVKLRVTGVKTPLNSPYNIQLSLGERAIERMSQRRMSWMQQDVANLRNNDKANKRDIDRTLLNITAFKAWKDKQGEALEGVEASAAIKIYKQQLAEIEAEFASIEGIVATLIVKPAEWLLYLDAYEVYSAKLKEALKLKNPDSINVSGFDEARATYIDTRDRLKKAINYQDALASQVALYDREIVNVESQREAILQEWANLLGKLWVLADSTGTGLVDKDGVALYVYDSTAETTTQYERYSAAANAYIYMLRAMIAALDFNENDEYKQLRKDYYREYSLIKTMISQGRVNRFDSIDVTLGGYNDKIDLSQKLSAIAIVTANKTEISSAAGKTIMRSSLLDTYEGISVEMEMYAIAYPSLGAQPAEYKAYERAATSFLSRIKNIIESTTTKTWTVTSDFVQLRTAYQDTRDYLREYELIKQ